MAARRPGDDVAREDASRLDPAGAGRPGRRSCRTGSLRRRPCPPGRRRSRARGQRVRARPLDASEGPRKGGGGGTGRAGQRRRRSRPRGSDRHGRVGRRGSGSTGTTSAAGGRRVASSFWGPRPPPRPAGSARPAARSPGSTRASPPDPASRPGRARGAEAAGGRPRARVEEPAPARGLDHRRRRRGLLGGSRGSAWPWPARREWAPP